MRMPVIIADTNGAIAVFLLFEAIRVALYGRRTLKSPFIMEDISQIVENPDIKSFVNPVRVFKKRFSPPQLSGQKKISGRSLFRF